MLNLAHLRGVLATHLTALVSAVLSVLFTALVVYLFGRRQERINRVRRAKDDFLRVIADQRTKFDMMRLQESEFYDQSIEVITGAVYKVKPYLKHKRQEALQSLLAEYRAHYAKNTFSRNAIVASVIYPSMRSGKDAIEILKEYLDRFAACVDPKA